MCHLKLLLLSVRHFCCQNTFSELRENKDSPISNDYAVKWLYNEMLGTSKILHFAGHLVAKIMHCVLATDQVKHIEENKICI